MFAFAFLASCDADKDRNSQISGARQIDNSDITWIHTYAGTEPVLSEEIKKVIAQLIEDRKAGKNDTRKKYLLLLKDPNRFVAAHVVLTKSRIGVRYPVSGR